MTELDILKQDVNGNKFVEYQPIIPEHKCEIIERHSKAIEFAEERDIYWFTPEQFKERLEELTKCNERIIIDVVDGVKNIILKDSILREFKEDKQEVIEIVDIIDNKERTTIHVKDFDKYINSNKSSVIYKFNDQRMIIWTDQIIIEAKKETKIDMQYR